MRGPTLRLRLLGGGAVAIAIALALAWVAMTLLFDRHIERGVQAELTRMGLQLTAGIDATNGRASVGAAPVDPRFGIPGSGLYWRVVDRDSVLRSRSLWDQDIASAGPPPSDRWRLRNVPGPYEHMVYVLERSVRPSSALPPVVVQIAENAHDIYMARRAFGHELALFLLLLWAVLALAAWVQVSLGLRPLVRLRSEVQALRRRPGDRLVGDRPAEIAPLVAAINDLADARETDVRRARQRAADLAHGLKTPLAALGAQTRALAQAGIATDGLDRAVASAGAAVEAELARARAAALRVTEHGSVSSPAMICARLVTVIERTDAGALIDFDLTLPDSTLPVDEGDLAEILGALIENAARYARRRVVIAGGRGRIVIADDGPGIEEAAIPIALGRGMRLDERGAGHGLGLSIAREITEATGGSIALGRAAIGGLAVTLAWADPANDAR